MGPGHVREGSGLWTGRSKLVGKRNPRPRDSWDAIMSLDPGGLVTLPLVFKAVPVFELASPAAPADVTVSVFGSATTAGQAAPDRRRPLLHEQGRLRLQRGGDYAHEYGHLLGLPDEYSHSNPQMHGVSSPLSHAGLIIRYIEDPAADRPEIVRNDDLDHIRARGGRMARDLDRDRDRIPLFTALIDIFLRVVHKAP